MNSYSAINTGWVLFATALVFFMQAGFALLEAGFTRSKNAGNIIMKNLIDFCIAVPLFLLLGFRIMYGSAEAYLSTGIPALTFVIFQTCFCGTSATIVSGAMAERTKFAAYCTFSAAMSMIIFPVCGRLIWGRGLLYRIGFHDFAGGTAVHLVGGCAALAGAYILGPRIGKYGKDGRSKAIPGHNLTISALGMFTLWLSWYGFNGGSTLGIDTYELGELASSIFIVTTICASVAALTTVIYTWVRYKKPDVSMTLNGAVGGMVISTAGCDVLSPIGAFIAGICAGLTATLLNAFIDKKLHIDDPVGAVGVHAGCGFVGTLLVGLLSQKSGLFYGYGFRQLGIQLLGALLIAAMVFVMASFFFIIINKTIGLRVPSKEEITGLDKVEHGLSNAYDGFMSMSDFGGYMPTSKNDGTKYTNEEIRKVQLPTSKDPAVTDSKITKIEIITKQNKFEELKEELNKIGITGITVSKVMGCGMQKGQEEYYRGTMVDMQLLPKIKLEIVVAKVPVADVVNVAKRVLYSGHIGDGKIFIYPLGNAIKVRTGEEGYDAMQNDD